MAKHTVKLDPNKLEVLSANQSMNGFNLKVGVDFARINDADWSGQGDTVEVELFETPANWIVLKAAAVVKTAFATTGTLTATVGTSADADMMVASSDMKTAGVKAKAGAIPAADSSGSSSATVIATFTTQASTGAPANITAGLVEFYFQIADADKLD